MKIVVLIWLIVCKLDLYGQPLTTFGKAVKGSDFVKIEQLVKAKIYHHRQGTFYFNGVGSGAVATFAPNLDTIVAWLKQQEGVVDAGWNKCENKLLLYPSYSAIGCLMQLKDTLIEKSFVVQEGATGRVNLFGWRFKLTEARSILVYKKMISSVGFVAYQRKLCNAK